MNRQLNRLAVAAIVLLVALVVATTYWQTWASAGLQDRQDNAIQRVVQFTIARGLIQGAGGKTTLRGEHEGEAAAARRSTSAAIRSTGSPRRRSATRPSRARRPGSSAR